MKLPDVFLRKADQRPAALKHSNLFKVKASLSDVMAFCTLWILHIWGWFFLPTIQPQMQLKKQTGKHWMQADHNKPQFPQTQRSLPAFRVWPLTRCYDWQLSTRTTTKLWFFSQTGFGEREAACTLTRWDVQIHRWGSGQICPWNGENGSRQTIVQWSAGAYVWVCGWTKAVGFKIRQESQCPLFQDIIQRSWAGWRLPTASKLFLLSCCLCLTSTLTE